MRHGGTCLLQVRRRSRNGHRISLNDRHGITRDLAEGVSGDDSFRAIRRQNTIFTSKVRNADRFMYAIHNIYVYVPTHPEGLWTHTR